MNSTLTGRTLNIHKLSPKYLHIYLMVFSFCYKGKHHRKMTAINYEGVRQQLSQIYGIDVSRYTIYRALKKCVELELLDKAEAKYVKQIGQVYQVIKTVYYRIRK